MRTALLLLLAIPAASAGCNGSRWARDDAVYAEKYPKHSDNVLKMVKQAVDARFVRGRTGFYSGFVGRSEPFAGGVQLGLFSYPARWLEARLGYAGLVTEHGPSLTSGAEFGARLQSPSRLAPFVGLGGYLGRTPRFMASDNVEVEVHTNRDSDYLAAYFPEVGAHFWITPRLRITASASYYDTTLQSDRGYLNYGVTLGLLENGFKPLPKECVELVESPPLGADGSLPEVSWPEDYPPPPPTESPYAHLTAPVMPPLRIE